MIFRSAVLTVLLCACACVSATDDGRTDCASYGQSCTSDDDCINGGCVAEPEQSRVDLEPLSLTCSCRSEAYDVGRPCRTPEDCSRGICLLTETCSRPCTSDSQCGSNQRCSTVYARTSESALQPLRGCVSLAELPEESEIHSEIYEDFFSDSGAAEAIDLPPVDPTTIVVFEHLAENAWPAFTTPCRAPICVDQLMTNDTEPLTLFDADLYSVMWRAEQEAPLNPVGSGTVLAANQSHPIAVMLPNGPRSALCEYGFRVLLTAENPGDMRLTELSGVSTGSRLDLNLFYLGGLQLAPSGERGPPLVKDALAVVESIYSRAGIEIGEVMQFEVAGGLREEFETIELRYGILEELPRLFALSAGARNPAINLFFVREIYDTVAISGGTPGPLGMHGTGGSGIALSVDSLADADLFGKVIAHEIGHFLGLFHTSEQAGFVLDPLPDTPECRLDRDRDNDAMLSLEECRDFGADNLMFWAMGSGTAITPEQKAVLRSALILHN
ncbi:MAG: hypothetical protein JXA30_15680 [Deltaproteobacteria bacterium]|nr:hypothetical protein [Deltaproteobacteria bacterium]